MQRNITLAIEELENDGLLNSADIELVEAARAAIKNSYSPYSGFKVAAAARLHDGNIVTGTNQENAAYPSGMCAERVALFTASSLHPGKMIKKLVVLARLANQTELAPASSCGACRQVMLEFEQRQGKPFEVIMQNQDRHWVKTASAETLLPFCFSNESLQVRK